MSVWTRNQNHLLMQCNKVEILKSAYIALYWLYTQSVQSTVSSLSCLVLSLLAGGSCAVCCEHWLYQYETPGLSLLPPSRQQIFSTFLSGVTQCCDLIDRQNSDHIFFKILSETEKLLARSRPISPSTSRYENKYQTRNSSHVRAGLVRVCCSVESGVWTIVAETRWRDFL